MIFAFVSSQNIAPAKSSEDTLEELVDLWMELQPK
jgi:hypothetical protein